MLVRTFIEPAQKLENLGVKLKLNANKTTIKNKIIILVDDSLSSWDNVI